MAHRCIWNVPLIAILGVACGSPIESPIRVEVNRDGNFDHEVDVFLDSPRQLGFTGELTGWTTPSPSIVSVSRGSTTSSARVTCLTEGDVNVSFLWAPAGEPHEKAVYRIHCKKKVVAIVDHPVWLALPGPVLNVNVLGDKPVHVEWLFTNDPTPIVAYQISGNVVTATCLATGPASLGITFVDVDGSPATFTIPFECHSQGSGS